jgi:tetratricopeptide (TPR) repeat protein
MAPAEGTPGEFSFDEPAPIDIPEPSPIDIPEPNAPGESPSGGLFDDDSAGDLFGSGGMDDAPPLDLDLPMPGDAPLFTESAVAEVEPDPVGEATSSFADDLFADSDAKETALDFHIPTPDEEPRAMAESAAPEASSEPEAEPEPEPEVEAADPEFMAMLELTMPRPEEEPIAIPDPEPVSLPPAAEDSLELPDLTTPSMGGGLEEDVFEPSAELMPSAEAPSPLVEEPVAAEPDPADLLSAEEKAELAQTMQADALDATLTNADAASKIAAYRKALEENPDNLVLRGRLADIHLKYGLLEDAVVQYRQVMRRSPDSISLLHRVIQAEFWNENYVEAGDSLLALAKLHLKRGEMHEALDTLQSVLSLDPLHFEARKELVSVFTALDESKLAAHHLRQLAETALTKGEVEGAIQAFQQLLEISADPTFEERLAQIYESQGDVAKALSSFQSLVGRYRAEERWEEAARVTERIVELDPDQLQDREALIELYQRLGQPQQAVEQQFQLARRYQERNDIERAVGLYEEVLKVQTDNHEARRYLVDAYLDGGRVSAALEQAEALTEHYLDTKDHNTAIYLYSRLVDADPENVELQERLVKFYGLAGDPENAKSRWIHISNLHERHERYERATEAVQKALELDENQPDLQHRLALLYAEKLNDNQAALNQLRKLFQIAPDRTDAVKMYIDLLLKEEQVAEAGKALQRLEQAGGDGVELKADVIALLKASVESNPGDLKARFNYGELCYHLGDLDHAIEQFQQTRRNPDFELISYNMLGLCFASKRGYMMLDLAIKQFQKGLESKGRSEQDYLEIRYNLAMVQYQNGRAKEALAELKECYNVDIAYRDVRSWIQKIEGELASGA